VPEVELRNITKRFGKITAVENINVKVKDKEYVTILGPSGCGKTTLVKVISGIWDATEGEVFIDGKRMEGIPTYERDLGYVFQNIALFPHLNVWDNVTYSPRVKDLEMDELERIGNEMLDLLNLLKIKAFFPNELSGGMQQKTALGRALSTNAKLLLLDEPLSALDTRVRLELRYELRRLVKDLGLTAIHVTHDQEEAMSVSDRIVVMKKGRIVEIDSPENLYNHPKTLFTANFVGESNFIEGRIVKVDEEIGDVEIRNKFHISIRRNGFKRGDGVVLVVRPENLILQSEEATNSIEGVITKITFMGAYFRYHVKLKSDDTVMVDIPTIYEKRFNKNDKVMVVFRQENLLVYAKPYEGLMEVLKLE